MKKIILKGCYIAFLNKILMPKIQQELFDNGKSMKIHEIFH